jgi:multicomponent Na+:H+ antiporter subunit G
MTDALDLVVVGLTWIGIGFVMLAAIGILRMPDVFSRMHTSTKAATLGAIFVAVAVALHFREVDVAIRSVALIGFLLLTAPLGAHLVARSGYLSGVPLADETVLDEAREHFERERAGGADEHSGGDGDPA